MLLAAKVILMNIKILVFFKYFYQGEVTADLYRGIGGGFQEVLKTMTDQFQEEGAEYPLTMTGQSFRRFKDRIFNLLNIFFCLTFDEHSHAKIWDFFEEIFRAKTSNFVESLYVRSF